ncbi:Ribosomal protein S18 [Penicillium riverlandense]|uniref:Ribosomal protein S18 n=1 Tax=Penicillium riverlandense TaxID=1903569 RepID=UPI002549B145|nr:Ribosomal protein S18 [Penicillium riverlandense]KAJ5815325.1 Ribosomal protein S18 [Penicillium riverlandense]
MSLNIFTSSFLRTAPGLSSCRWSSTSALHQRLGLGQRQSPKPKVQHSRRLPSRQKIIAEQKAQGESRALERFHTRDWKAGDVYAPHDLSPQEMKKWSKRHSPSKDAFDALNLNPLDLYKNFSIMSEYISPLGRIKHRSETGLRPVNQRKIAKAIRRARGLGLMPSVHKHPEILASDSRSRESIWAASPSTTRGQPTQLSSDAKGERLAYAANKSIFLRSIDDPAVAKQYTEHKVQTTVARFSPSGFYVASGDAAGLVRVWDCVGDGILKGEYSIINGRINDLAWDGDSQRIIAVGDGKQRYGHCITWDSGNTVGEIYGHTQQINSVAIRQQRPLRAATAGDDKKLVFYHGAPFKFNMGIGDKHSNYIYGVGFSPDGSTLASVGADRKIWLYDGKTGETKGQIGEGEHTGSIFGLSWSKDSKKFVTASADRTVKIWDVEAGKAAQSWTLGEEGAMAVRDQQVGVVWPPGRSDNLLISLSLSGDLNYLVEGTPKPRQVIQGHQKNITSLTQSVTGDKETLWTGSFEGRVCSWDVASGTAEEIEGDSHSGYIAGLAPTSEGAGRIYSVGWDDTIRSVDVAAKTYTGSTTKLTGQPKGIAAGDSTVLVGAAEAVEIFNDGKKTGEYKTKFAVTTVAAHGAIAAVGGEDGSVEICDVSSSSLSSRALIKASRNQISTISFSPDASLLAIGDLRGRVLVHKVADGSLVTDRWTAHNARITSLAWNKAGSHVVSGSLDTNIFVWSLANPGDWLEVKNAHKEGVNGVTWIEGSTKIASAGADAAVKVWKVEGLK